MKAVRIFCLSAVVALLLVSVTTSDSRLQLMENRSLRVENVSENVNLELWPNATFHVEDNLSASVYQENILPGDPPLSSANLDTHYTVPADEKLQVNISGSAQLTPSAADSILGKELTLNGHTDNIEDWLTGLSADFIENELLDNLEGKRISEIDMENVIRNKMESLLSENYVTLIENLNLIDRFISLKENYGYVIIENADCTYYSWDGENYILEGDFNFILDNIGPLGRTEVKERFPMSENMDYSYGGNTMNVTAEAGGEDARTSLDLTATQDGSWWHGNVNMKSSGKVFRTNDNVKFEDYQDWTDSSYATMLGGGWTLVTKYWPVVDNYWSDIRQNWLDNSQIRAKFRTHENADVRDLPGGYKTLGSNYYEWLDDNAIDAAISVIKRDTVPKIDYPVTEGITESITNVTPSQATLNMSIDYGSYDSVDAGFRYRQVGENSWNYTAPENDYTAAMYSDNIDLAPVSDYEIESVVRGDWWYDYGPTQTLEMENFKLKLGSGWNLVTMPVNPENKMVENIFSQKTVVEWTEDQGYRYLTSKDNVEVGDGYWVYSRDPENITLLGLPVTSLELELQEGWSLVGVPGTETFGKENVFGNRTTFGWFGSGEGYRLIENDNILPGRGYWVYSGPVENIQVP